MLRIVKDETKRKEKQYFVRTTQHFDKICVCKPSVCLSSDVCISVWRILWLWQIAVSWALCGVWQFIVSWAMCDYVYPWLLFFHVWPTNQTITAGVTACFALRHNLKIENMSTRTADYYEPTPKNCAWVLPNLPLSLRFVLRGCKERV
jgi:hypothetical protein